jgi:hypothetical protein
MHPAAFLALLTIALLALAALRLELDFRRGFGKAPEGVAPGPERRPPAPKRPPELRAAPAGGYWQAPVTPWTSRRG